MDFRINCSFLELVVDLSAVALRVLDLQDLLVACLAVAFRLVEGLLVVNRLVVGEHSEAYHPYRLVEDHLVECSGFRQGRPFVQVACPGLVQFADAIRLVVATIQAVVCENVNINNKNLL